MRKFLLITVVMALYASAIHGQAYKKPVDVLGESITVFGKKYFVWERETFLYGNTADNTIGKGLRASTSGGSISNWSVPESDVLGAIFISSGTAAGNYAVVRSQASQLSTTGSEQIFLYRIRLTATGDSVIARIGLGDVVDGSTTPTDGIWFEYNTDSSTVYWRTVTSAAGSRTWNTTTKQADVSWHWLMIIASSSEVKFYIDSDLVSTHTTNIPTGNSQLFGILISVYTHDTSQEQVRVDDFIWAVDKNLRRSVFP